MISCGIAPKKWRSAAKSGFGLEGRKGFREPSGHPSQVRCVLELVGHCCRVPGHVRHHGKAKLLPHLS